MSRSTEWLLRISAGIFIVYFGWQLATQTLIAQLQANQRAAVAEQQLAACKGERK